MRIVQITKPLHIQHPAPAKISDERHYLVIGKMTMKSLIRNYVCHVVPDDARTPIICTRECDHFRYCEFGKEYIRRLEAGA